MKDKKFWIDVVVCCFFPNLIGIIYSLIRYLDKKTTAYAMLFLGLFVQFLTYNFYSVDNSLRYIRAFNGLVMDEWISGNPLDYLLMFFQMYFHMQSSFVFYFYILMAFVFWFYSINKYRDDTSMITFVVVLICSIGFRNVIDLLYFTLAVLFVTCFDAQSTLNTNLKKWSILIAGVYIFHPGLFLVLLPSGFLYFVYMKNKKLIYYISLLLVFLFGQIITNIGRFSTGIELIDIQLESLNNYTSEGTWGIREKSLNGITYTIQFYIIPFIYFMLFIYIASWKRVRKKMYYAMFQVSVLLYPSSISFVTLSERILVVMTVTASILLYEMTYKKLLTPRKLVVFIASLFFFITLRCSNSIMPQYLFRKNDDIGLRCLYMPSLLLFDYETWGYSDLYIRQNSLVFDKFN